MPMIKPYFLPLSEVSLSDRQRKYFDESKIIDLAEDIKLHGLIHAPAVTSLGRLIVGERRLRAMQMLHRKETPFTYQGAVCPPEHIPVTFIPVEKNLSDEEIEIQLKEIELAENLLRENLSWQERAQAERELHILRKEQTGGKQTLEQTAEEIKGSKPTNLDKGNLKENLFLAEHLTDPEISKVKNRKDALRIAKEKVLRERRAALAEEYKINPKKSESPHMLILGDCLEQWNKIPEFSLLLTDPPYGMDAGEFNSQFTIAHEYEDSSTSWPELMESLAINSYKHSKDLAHAFVFCHILNFPELAAKFSSAGWDVWPRPLIWDKGSLGSLPKPHHGPRFCYEAILFANKGNKPVLRTGRDVLPITNPSKTFHAAEKPVELFSELISRTLEPGEIVLDPFCGSGTIFPAATRQAVKAVGIEKSSTHHDTALIRLREGL